MDQVFVQPDSAQREWTWQTEDTDALRDGKSQSGLKYCYYLSSPGCSHHDLSRLMMEEKETRMSYALPSLDNGWRTAHPLTPRAPRERVLRF
ncbi:cortexin-3 isoform X1 [Cavia porcellus]|uniref:cortexin-3 isoform X1 n=1 Tax=Cavia porcellus TaxID=10141 RepID=UPI0006618ED7|nr:cortexin-3 isoform X1 [Cavia porcellus]